MTSSYKTKTTGHMLSQGTITRMSKKKGFLKYGNGRYYTKLDTKLWKKRDLVYE